MSWRERTAQILGNVTGTEPTKAPKGLANTENALGSEPTKPTEPLLTVLSVPSQPRSGEHAELTALVLRVADGEGFSDQDRAEALENAWSDPSAWLDQFRRLAAEPPRTHQDESSESSATLAHAERQGCSSADSGAIIIPSEQPDTTPQNAFECARCKNLDMKEGPNHYGKRQFSWTCRRGHR
ncbi:MAG: hypothetical protein JWN13_1558, partial [Betaproteobacteria bacterium]|nr:hypothetical protein [Betaproteobacteria bacterium]